MAELYEDFELLIKKSCKTGLLECEALHNLPQLAEGLAGRTPRAQSDVLRQFLRDVVSHAIARIVVPEERNVVQAAAVYIGLDPWSGANQKRRGMEAGKILGRSESTIRRDPYRAEFKNALVEAVSDFLDDEAALAKFIKENRRIQQATAEPRLATSPPMADQPDSPLRSAYVHREQLEAQFKEAVEAGAKVIVLHGLPGMGKTWLAQELAQELHPDRVEAPIFRISDGRIASPDPYGAFAAAGMPLLQPVTATPVEYLALLICSANAPLFTIIDGLNSADELRGLLPQNQPRHVVIVSCRDRGTIRREHWQFLRVPEMESYEATSMVRSLMPAASDIDAELLVSTLSAYPLVIGYACPFLNDQKIPIVQFCNDLKKDLPRVAGNVATDDTSTLLAVLSRIVDTIQKSDELASNLLAVLASVSFDDVFLERSMLYRFANVFEGEPVSLTRFGEAMSMLERFSLFDSHPYSRPDLQSAPLIFMSMHELTQHLIKGFITCDAIANIASIFAAIHIAFTGPDTELQDWVKATTNRGWENVYYEAAFTAMVMVKLCGAIIIDDDPPGARDKIEPDFREFIEESLAFLIIYFNDAFSAIPNERSEACVIHFPWEWILWAHTYPGYIPSESDNPETDPSSPRE
jgi:hypothetical protein